MKYLYLFIAALFLISCSDKIDLEIKQSRARVSFDGVVSDKVDASYVKVQLSVDYTNNNTFPSINNATVNVIEMPSGSTYLFTYDPTVASYLPPAGFAGQYGATYVLEAVVNGEVYRSSEQEMKQTGRLDAGIFNESTGYPRYGALIDEGTYLFYGAIDKVSDGDFYRWQFTVDGEYKSQADEVRLNSDEFLPPGDSLVDQRPFELEDDENQITVRQTRINKDISEFWDQYGRNGTIQGQPFAPPPSPLPGNMRNVNDTDEEVFGIFSAESEVTVTLMVP